MFGRPVTATIAIVSGFLVCRGGVSVKRVIVESNCNILSIERDLDGCVRILSLGRFFFFSFFLSSCVHCFQLQKASCSPSYGENKNL